MPALESITRSIDQEKHQRFTDAAISDVKGTLVLMMANLGDRLGLFRALAAEGGTSAEIAERTGLRERYVREWLAGMACAGYLEFDPATRAFALPPEAAPALADESSPFFLGGIYQEMPALWRILGKLESRFAEGGGLSISDYGRDWWDGMERFTASWFDNFLLQEWIPRAGDLRERLEQGLHVADVGCGRGRALARLAKAFPGMTGVGYDLSEGNLERARRLAEDEGVSDRLTFERRDVHAGLSGTFGLVTCFDALHDLADPAGALRAIHDALEEGGSCLLLEFKVSGRLEENVGPLGAMLYGWSLTYCLTTALAAGGEGVGTCGMPEERVRDLALGAGFSSVELVPFDNPFNNLYLLRR